MPIQVEDEEMEIGETDFESTNYIYQESDSESEDSGSILDQVQQDDFLKVCVIFKN